VWRCAGDNFWVLRVLVGPLFSVRFYIRILYFTVNFSSLHLRRSNLLLPGNSRTDTPGFRQGQFTWKNPFAWASNMVRPRSRIDAVQKAVVNRDAQGGGRVR
jgi:hypothetical protein